MQRRLWRYSAATSPLEKRPMAVFRTGASLPAAKGATFATCTDGTAQVGHAARSTLGWWLWLAAIAFCAPALADTSYALLAHAAPDFALHAIAGGNVRLSEHRGDVVILSFWGSRCTPCRAQLAALNQSLATYRSAGLQVYGINVDDDQSRALAFAHGEAVTFPLLLDPEKAVSRNYLVDNLPMTLLIDRSGVVRNVFRDYNAKSESLYLQQLRALLNE
jgi:peroxiredoxin